jgi:hypothetical protein
MTSKSEMSSILKLREIGRPCATSDRRRGARDMKGPIRRSLGFYFGQKSLCKRAYTDTAVARRTRPISIGMSRVDVVDRLSIGAVGRMVCDGRAVDCAALEASVGKL